jgi:hypothetical protein
MAAAAEAALAAPARHAVTLPDGRPIYEWSQSLADVDVYLPAPPGAPGSAFDVSIGADRLRLGLKGNPPYLDVRLFVLRVWPRRACTVPAGVGKWTGKGPWAPARRRNKKSFFDASGKNMK